MPLGSCAECKWGPFYRNNSKVSGFCWSVIVNDLKLDLWKEWDCGRFYPGLFVDK